MLDECAIIPPLSSRLVYSNPPWMKKSLDGWNIELLVNECASSSSGASCWFGWSSGPLRHTFKISTLLTISDRNNFNHHQLLLSCIFRSKISQQKFKDSPSAENTEISSFLVVRITHEVSSYYWGVSSLITTTGERWQQVVRSLDFETTKFLVLWRLEFSLFVFTGCLNEQEVRRKTKFEVPWSWPRQLWPGRQAWY